MTIEFLTPLVTRQVGAQRKRLEFALVLAVDGALLEVPAGFESDGASVPRFLWALYPPFGELYEPAAWAHDYCYQHAERFDLLTRAKADQLLYDGARALGFRRTGARNLWLGVRVGGWLPWLRCRRKAALVDANA